jgi:hypothetical protein
MWKRLAYLVLSSLCSIAVPHVVDAQSLERAYDIGSPTYTDIWVDPVGGDDAREGGSRGAAVRTVDRAWRLIPVNSPSTPFTSSGYRIRLVAGTYPESSLPNYWDLRYGSATAPIVIEGADGPLSARLQGDINMANVAYVYLLNLDISPEPAGDAFHCEACDHVLIRDSRLVGGTWSRTTPAASLAHETVKVNQSTHIYIEDTEIRGAGDNAVDFVAVQYGHIVRSRIGNAQDWCAYAKGGSAYLVIEGNTFSDCGVGGFTVGQGTGYQFMTSPWIHYEGYGIAVINNLIENVDGAGLGVNGGYNVLLAWNTMVNVGTRSHVLEVGHGSRSCDGISGAPDRVRCSEFLAAGGWGTTVVDDGSNFARIPSRHVFIVNNLIYNPDGVSSQWQHFSIAAPYSGEYQTGSNVPTPTAADTDLRIAGNVIWNGTSGHPLGIDSSSTGCADSNPTCNTAQLLANNAINTVRPVFTTGYRVAVGGLPAPVAVPAFDWTDRPMSPSAPAGPSTFDLRVDIEGRPREASNHAGAYLPVRPSLTLSRSVLRYVATKAGTGATALTAVTPGQTMTVSFPSGTPAWTAEASDDWMVVTPASGSGAGVVTVTIAPSHTGYAGVSSLTGVIVVSTVAGSHTPASVNVSLLLGSTPGSTAAPFGQVDTPVHEATGVQGAIGVTGWALDDIGVSGVKIYRNCLSFDHPSSCQTVLGQSVVFIGDAAFLAGARTDVETAFSTHPLANRAGWGYLMLTSMLPNVPAEAGYGGVGGLTLYAVATDMEGQQRLLGRSADPASPLYNTPTAITMANDTIAKPFGAIDTPGQGATVSGVLNNFGWALTPGTTIPLNGSTMTVFIDGVPRAQVTYNQCRGTVGNPVPDAVYCDDDVANIFGNATPQASLTPRLSNPSPYQNLDAGRGAIGSYSIDTTTLTNGLHTIAWSVTDTLARTEGIGSRFFNVVNVTSGIVSGVVSTETMPDVLDADAALRARPAAVRGPSWALDFLRPRTDGVWARTGFDLTAPWSALEPDGQGQLMVEIPAGGRVELWLGSAADRGALVVGATLRALPPGSTLAGQTFAWTPPVGYVGAYRLTFGGEQWRTDVVVVVR